MILALIMSAVTTASIQQIDKAGRDAFNSLRDYQVIVLQHNISSAELEAKLAIAYECVWDSLKYSQDKTNSDQVLSLRRSQKQAIIALGYLSNTPELKQAYNKILITFNKLFSLFPDMNGEFLQHPPERKK